MSIFNIVDNISEQNLSAELQEKIIFSIKQDKDKVTQLLSKFLLYDNIDNIEFLMDNLEDFTIKNIDQGKIFSDLFNNLLLIDNKEQIKNIVQKLDDKIKVELNYSDEQKIPIFTMNKSKCQILFSLDGAGVKFFKKLLDHGELIDVSDCLKKIFSYANSDINKQFLKELSPNTLNKDIFPFFDFINLTITTPYFHELLGDNNILKTNLHDKYISLLFVNSSLYHNLLGSDEKTIKNFFNNVDVLLSDINIDTLSTIKTMPFKFIPIGIYNTFLMAHGFSYQGHISEKYNKAELNQVDEYYWEAITYKSNFLNNYLYHEGDVMKDYLSPETILKSFIEHPFKSDLCILKPDIVLKNITEQNENLLFHSMIFSYSNYNINDFKHDIFKDHFKQLFIDQQNDKNLIAEQLISSFDILNNNARFLDNKQGRLIEEMIPFYIMNHYNFLNDHYNELGSSFISNILTEQYKKYKEKTPFFESNQYVVQIEKIILEKSLGENFKTKPANRL